MPLKEIQKLGVSRLQILDDSGVADPSLDPGLPEEELLRIYRHLCLGREADERMLKLQRTGRMGTFPPCSGQEAVSVGAAAAISEKDWFVGAFRELPGRLMRGQDLVQILKFWAGYEEGSSYSLKHRNLPDTIVISSHIPQAVGIAYSMKLRKEDSVVLNFFGDGATSEGDFHEGLNFAAVWKSPVVFVIQNNGWAISTGREKQTASETLAQKALAYGMPGIVVDGNDVLAVYSAVREAVERARRGEGPTLIEAQTYRMSLHTTADDPTRYRKEEDVEEWRDKDPLKRFRLYLENRGIWDESRQEALNNEIRKEVALAVESFENRESVRPDTPFDHVLENSHPELERQREIFLQNISRNFPAEGVDHA
ncbi:MAG: pyruvate dehydrogenase (acetyl-transferring) E1 component subunit alpha [Candidatus Krumholzibacteria bacterium]|jgi:pyruvate dehydrogenase E1 component alpha subunit|nr:pyruvate dehydrogenase (acetyl-transferring) E1 component subunit alpha [Candidatus Krumholzibacteria bacterium]